MASQQASFGARLYKSISVVLLTGWTLTALGFSALDLVNQNRKLIEPIASISLLTFLACRLLVFLSPSENETNAASGSIAQSLATGYRKSRQHAFATLLLSATWLYAIAQKAFLMFFMTVFGGVMAAFIYNDGFQNAEVTVEDPAASASASDLDQTSLAQIDEIKNMAGFDPVALFQTIPPQALIYCAAIMWGNLAILTVYVLRISWRSLRIALGSGRVDSTKQ